MNNRVLLIYPPHTRNTEPPLGLGILTGIIRKSGGRVRLIDLNVDAGPELAVTVPDRGDTRSHRAALHIRGAVQRLQRKEGYDNFSRYQTALNHYGEATRILSGEASWTVTPGDYSDPRYPDFSPGTITQILEGPWDTPFMDGMINKVGSAVTPDPPDIVGISIIYRTQFIPGVMLAAWLHAEHPGLRVILGGSFLHALPPDSLDVLRHQFDFISTGDGIADIRSYLGLSDAPADLFPDPDFSDLDFTRYFAPHPVIPVHASRGCYWARCAFCDECNLPFAMPSPDAFAAQLSRLHRRYRPGMFHFTDNAIPPEILKFLAEAGSPVPWYGFTRMLPMLANPAFTRKLRDSGCEMLQLGLESPVPGVLKIMRKGVDPALLDIILDNLRRSGIKSYVYLMFGFPGQTETDNRAALEFLVEHPPDFINASIFRMPRNSQMAIHPRDYGISLDIRKSDTRINQPFQPNGILMDDLRKWISGVFYREPAIRNARNRTPRYYKSNHAAYF